MIGLLFIYFVGKAFYQLANKFGKNRWGYAILGIISYYAVILLILFIFEALDAYLGYRFFKDLSSFAYGLVAVPFGLLACWRYYKILERQWTGKTMANSEILDGDLMG